MERTRDMARQEELTLQAERKAAEMRKEKREEERRAAEKRLDGDFNLSFSKPMVFLIIEFFSVFKT